MLLIRKHCKIGHDNINMEKRPQGFTVVEVASVTALVSVVAALSYPLITNLIARTEVHRTASFANEIVAESMGIAGTRKEWVSVNDGRTRISHALASGQQVGLEEPFIVGGDRLNYPGDPAGSPGETINCRCVSIYTTPDFL